MTKSEQRKFLIGASLGVMLNPLNSSMISLALYSIQKDFNVSYATVSWLVTAFYIASMVGQPVMGKVSDLAGRRRMFLFGLALFAVAASGAILAKTFLFLLLMRILQSLATSPLFPSTMATIRSGEVGHKGSAIALLATVNSAMAALGPTVGGLLIGFFSWQAIFSVNLPFIALSALIAWHYYPKDEAKQFEWHELLRDIDLPGVLFFSGAVISIVLFLILAKEEAYPALLIAGILFFIAFMRIEYRVTKPFINPHLFAAHPGIFFSLLLVLLTNVVYYVIFFGVPLYFQGKMHLSVEFSGILMLACSGMSVLAGPFVGQVIDKKGHLSPLTAGIFVLFAGALCFRFFFTNDIIWQICLIMALCGIGNAFTNVAVQGALVAHTPEDAMGMTSGLLQSFRYLGAIVSSVAIALVITGDMTAYAFRSLTILMIIGSICALLVLVVLARIERQTTV